MYVCMYATRYTRTVRWVGGCYKYASKCTRVGSFGEDTIYEGGKSPNSGGYSIDTCSGGGCPRAGPSRRGGAD